MFRKKKKKEENKSALDFKNWETDFGFLNLILSRKKNITKQYLINTYSKQKGNKAYLSDSEIEAVVQRIVEEVLGQIGNKYKTFLIEKYFGSEEALDKYIVEDVYVDLVTDAINENLAKVRNSMRERVLKTVNTLNKQNGNG